MHIHVSIDHSNTVASLDTILLSNHVHHGGTNCRGPILEKRKESHALKWAVPSSSVKTERIPRVGGSENLGFILLPTTSTFKLQKALFIIAAAQCWRRRRRVKSQEGNGDRIRFVKLRRSKWTGEPLALGVSEDVCRLVQVWAAPRPQDRAVDQGKGWGGSLFSWVGSLPELVAPVAL